MADSMSVYFDVYFPHGHTQGVPIADVTRTLKDGSQYINSQCTKVYVFNFPGKNRCHDYGDSVEIVTRVKTNKYGEVTHAVYEGKLYRIDWFYCSFVRQAAIYLYDSQEDYYEANPLPTVEPEQVKEEEYALEQMNEALETVNLQVMENDEEEDSLRYSVKTKGYWASNYECSTLNDVRAYCIKYLGRDVIKEYWDSKPVSIKFEPITGTGKRFSTCHNYLIDCIHNDLDILECRIYAFRDYNQYRIGPVHNTFLQAKEWLNGYLTGRKVS